MILAGRTLAQVFTPGRAGGVRYGGCGGTLLGGATRRSVRWPARCELCGLRCRGGHHRSCGTPRYFDGVHRCGGSSHLDRGSHRYRGRGDTGQDRPRTRGRRRRRRRDLPATPPVRRAPSQEIHHRRSHHHDRQRRHPDDLLRPRPHHRSVEHLRALAQARIRPRCPRKRTLWQLVRLHTATPLGILGSTGDHHHAVTARSQQPDFPRCPPPGTTAGLGRAP